MQPIELLNQDIANYISQLEQVAAENVEADDLVSKLLELVEQRQILLDEVSQSPKEEDREFLQEQLELTRQFTTQSVSLLQHRQDLLHLGRKNQRQLNVYKSIDSNR